MPVKNKVTVGYFYIHPTFELVSEEPDRLELPKHPMISICPALTDIVSNTFIIRAPFSCKVVLTKDDTFYLDPTSELTDAAFDTFFDVTKKHFEPKDGRLIQMHPCVGFTTNEKDLTMEVFPPFLEYRPDYPGYNTAAKFNIYNWLRNVPVGLIWCDRTKPLVLKKGEPLCYVRFNTTKRIELKHIPYTKEMEKELDRNVSLKYMIKNHSRVAMERAGLIRPRSWF
jgi:hypothetical protein